MIPPSEPPPQPTTNGERSRFTQSFVRGAVFPATLAPNGHQLRCARHHDSVHSITIPCLRNRPAARVVQASDVGFARKAATQRDKRVTTRIYPDRPLPCCTKMRCRCQKAARTWLNYYCILGD